MGPAETASRPLPASLPLGAQEGRDLGDNWTLRFQAYFHDRTCFLIPRGYCPPRGVSRPQLSGRTCCSPLPSTCFPQPWPSAQQRAALTFSTVLLSEEGVRPDHKANLQGSPSTCSVTPSSEVCRQEMPVRGGEGRVVGNLGLGWERERQQRGEDRGRGFCQSHFNRLDASFIYRG